MRGKTLTYAISSCHQYTGREGEIDADGPWVGSADDNTIQFEVTGAWLAGAQRVRWWKSKTAFINGEKGEEVG